MRHPRFRFSSKVRICLQKAFTSAIVVACSERLRIRERKGVVLYCTVLTKASLQYPPMCYPETQNIPQNTRYQSKDCSASDDQRYLRTKSSLRRGLERDNHHITSYLCDLETYFRIERRIEAIGHTRLMQPLT